MHFMAHFAINCIKGHPTCAEIGKTLFIKSKITFFHFRHKKLHKNFADVQKRYYLCTKFRKLCNERYTKFQFLYREND